MAVKKDFNLNRVANTLDDIFIDAINQLGNHLNVSIQNGLDESTDIHGKPFKKLKKSTIKARENHPKRPENSPKPLLDKGQKDPQATNALRSVNKKLATTASKVFVLKAKTPYGTLHNTGFVNPKGAFVPKREWFGMTKDIKPGGDQYKRAMLDVKLRVVSRFKAGR